MKKFILFFSLCILSFSLSAEPCRLVDKKNGEPQESESFRYFTTGTGPIFVIPNFGLGYRSRTGCFGYDLGLSLSTVFIAHQLQGAASYHYYFSPEQESSYYVGLGAAGSFFFLNQRKDGVVTLSPDFVLGKLSSEGRLMRRFVEIHVQGPYLGRFRRVNFPFMYFKYGVGF